MARMGWQVPALLCVLAALGAESVRGQETFNTPWCQENVDESKLTVVSVRYSFEDIELQGVVAYNTEAMGPQPVVMVAHDWNGLDQYEVWRAKYLAMQGYVGFAFDMYGVDVPVGDDLPIPQRAQLVGQTFANATRTQGILNAAIDVANGLEMASDRKAVLGYCYGGTIALDLARLGLVDGAGAFHVGTITPTGVAPPFMAGAVPVSVWNGYEDSIPAEDYKTLLDTLEAAGGNSEVTLFSDTVHAFTEPSGPLLRHEPGAFAAYSPYADKQSFASALKWLEGVFEQPGAEAAMAAPAADVPAVAMTELIYADPFDGENCASTAYYLESATGKLPVVFVLPDADGIGGFEADQATLIAQMGYLALVVDVYCEAVAQPVGSQAEAASLAADLAAEPSKLRSRVQSASDALIDTPASNKFADPTKFAAIGFGSGGTAALDIVRNPSAPAFQAVVAFHADSLAPLPGVDAVSPAMCSGVSVMALQSYANSRVTDAEIAAWQDELTAGGIRWQYTYYGADVPKDFVPTEESEGTYEVERSMAELTHFLTLVFADAIEPPTICVEAGPKPESDPVPESCSVPECDEACMAGVAGGMAGGEDMGPGPTSACSGACAARFDKCAGDDGPVSACCEAGDACVRKNAFYAQCITAERRAANAMSGEWSGEELVCSEAGN